MCPLRDDLVAYKKDNRKSQLGFQLDGAAASCIPRSSSIEKARSAPVEVISLDSESEYAESDDETITEDCEDDDIINNSLDAPIGLTLSDDEIDDKSDDFWGPVQLSVDNNGPDAPIDLTLSDDDNESDEGEGEDVQRHADDAEEDKENIRPSVDWDHLLPLSPLPDYEDLPPIPSLTPSPRRHGMSSSSGLVSPPDADVSDNKSVFEQAVENIVIQYADRFASIEALSTPSRAPSTPSPVLRRPTDMYRATQAMQTLPAYEPDSRLLTGPYPDGTESEFNDDIEEGARDETLQTPPDSSLLDDNIIAAPQLPFSGMDYVDLSAFAPPSPCSHAEVEETEPLLSLSHIGTLKRKRATSPEYNNDDRKRGKREYTPNLPRVSSLIERKRRDLDRKLQHVDDHASPSPLFVEQAYPRPPSVATFMPDLVLVPSEHREADFTAPASAPKGPRAQTGTALVCFYWYHKGYCSPRRKNGRPIRCTYAHDLRNPDAKVSLPPHIDEHHECSRPLCPVQLGRDDHNALDLVIPEHNTALFGSQRPIMQTRIHDSLDYGGEAILSPHIKEETLTPTKFDSLPFTDVTDSYSFSPRDIVSEAQTSAGEHRFKRYSRAPQLPKLTGVSRLRFKIQKAIMEKWQAENIVPASALKEAVEKEEMKQLNKKLWKQKKKDARKQKDAHKKKGYVLEDRDGFLRAVSAELTPEPARPVRAARQSKESKVRRQGSALLDAVRANRDDSKASTPLVDYELPGGQARLSWDTDVIRRLFGEIT
jgi:hypothetical protein